MENIITKLPGIEIDLVLLIAAVIITVILLGEYCYLEKKRIGGIADSETIVFTISIIVAIIQFLLIVGASADLMKDSFDVITWAKLLSSCIFTFVVFPNIRRKIENMERKETQIIKEVLLDSCFGTNPKLAKEYGTSEVTIGFQRNGNGKEVVDFMSFDAKKNIFRCYEIKVSMEDLRSKAKKSWYGNYNYLVVSSQLFAKQSVSDWKNEIPEHVGLIVVNPITKEKRTVIRAKRQEIEESIIETLKTSLLRTLFYKNTTSASQKRKV